MTRVVIETDRLKLREWREADKPLFSSIHADPEVMQYLGGTRAASESNDVVEQLMRLSEIGEPTFWAAERTEDGVLLGAVGLHCIGTDFSFGPALEAGWRLGREHWGKGYATEAACAVLDYAFESLNRRAFTHLRHWRTRVLKKSCSGWD